ncbi:hypothetical protein AURDEDRAFT_176434 [Auricularia subglabra TFB-10046 SS5]|uniref:Uncharacterized protein n=1 Tax=Auricularia subglabra (strain TFB-10046 / SS5) TaxID=717982 RepID=J0WPZ1_AURST|nr:hypothetical protein AURDEDRAFT_176434 [Auricularia subglabra TFB-10046 SS5]
MANVFVDFSLELRYPSISPPRRARDPSHFVYFGDVDLDGSKMTVVVPVPRDSAIPLYPHGTRAQVMGSADVVGNTFFMRLPSVFVSDQPKWRAPFVLFKASVTLSDADVFAATVAGGASWPPAAGVRCVRGTSSHLQRVGVLAPSSIVSVSGHLVGFDDGILEVDVHDVSRLDDVPPCNAASFVPRSVLSPGQEASICEWLSACYPYDVERDEEVACPDPSATRAPVLALATSQPELAEAAGVCASDDGSPSAGGCSAEDESSLRLAITAAFAFRDEGPIGQTPVDGVSELGTPTELDSSSWSSPSYLTHSAVRSPVVAPRLASPVVPAAAVPAPAAVTIPVDVIDLTLDSSDDESVHGMPLATHPPAPVVPRPPVAATASATRDVIDLTVDEGDTATARYKSGHAAVVIAPDMPPFFLDAHLLLRSPAVVAAKHSGGPQSHVYFSTIDVDGLEVDVVIAVSIPPGAFAQLHPHGVRAHVMGWAELAGDTVFVKNPTVIVNSPVVAKASLGDASFWRVAPKRAWPSALDVRCLINRDDGPVVGPALDDPVWP